MALVNAQTLRDSLARWLNLPQEQAQDLIRETILVRNGAYCGRRFTAERHSLTWFVEENQIKLTGPDGRLLLATSASSFISGQSERRAA